MRKALICDKWELDLLDNGTGGHFKWLNRPRYIRALGHNALCQEWLFQQAPLRGVSVVEPFGGLGIASVIIEHMLVPTSHLVTEIDDDCVNQLHYSLSLYTNVRVEKGDARSILLRPLDANLYVLDFASFTIGQYAGWREQFNAIVQRRPLAVTWYDSSASHLHLHKQRYAALFDSPVSNRESYAQAMSQFMWTAHGYSITHAAYEPVTGMSYFLGQAQPPTDIEFFAPQKEAVGLRFVPNEIEE